MRLARLGVVDGLAEDVVGGADFVDEVVGPLGVVDRLSGVTDLTPMLGVRFEDALVYASGLHARQCRKGTDVPYVSHLLAVASLVLEDGGGEDEAIAALLHDAVEDQEAEPGEIGERFGEQVAAIVVECSGPMGDESGPWRARKQATIDQVGRSTPGALRVELADKLHNTRAILADYRRVGDELWGRFNAPDGRDDVLWYYGELSVAFRAATTGFLVDELERTVQALHDLTGVAWTRGPARKTT